MMDEKRKLAIIDIEKSLLQWGAERWYLQKLANRIFKYFSNNYQNVIANFTSHGWTTADLYEWLKNGFSFARTNQYWALNYEYIFFAEWVLVNSGLSLKTAHTLAVTQIWIFHISPTTLETTIRTLLALGYDEGRIRMLANTMPHLFHLPKAEIIRQCHEASKAQSGLLWNTNISIPKDSTNVSKAVEHIKDTNAVDVITDKTFKANNTSTEPAIKPTSIIMEPATVLSTDAVADDASAKETDKDKTYAKINDKPKKGKPAKEDLHESRGILDIEKLQSVITSATPHMDEPWEQFAKDHDWILNPESREFTACITIMRWVPLLVKVTPAILEDSYEHGARARFWRSLLLANELKPILETEPQILELRMFILRKIGRDFVAEPEWLLKNWEQLNATELRYRLNQVTALNARPERKPYILMLLEPDRGRFLERLEKYRQRFSKRPAYLDPGYWEDCDTEENLAFHARPMSSEELRARLLADRQKKTT